MTIGRDSDDFYQARQASPITAAVGAVTTERVTAALVAETVDCRPEATYGELALTNAALDPGTLAALGVSMCSLDQRLDIPTAGVRPGVDRRRIVAALIMVSDEQSWIWQQRDRLTDQLKALARQDAALARRRAQLVDELQALAVPSALSDDFPDRHFERVAGWPDPCGEPSPPPRCDLVASPALPRSTSHSFGASRSPVGDPGS